MKKTIMRSFINNLSVLIGLTLALISTHSSALTVTERVTANCGGAVKVYTQYAAVPAKCKLIKVEKFCPAGYTVQGNSCITAAVTPKPVTPTPTPVKPTPVTPVKPAPVIPSPIIKASCPAGWTTSGSTCYSPAGWGNKCNSGDVLKNGLCTKQIESRTTASCPNGMSMPGNDGMCKTYNIRTRTFVAPTARATCAAGSTMQGSSCIKTTISTYKPPLSCSVGTPEGPYCKTPPTCSGGLRNVGGNCVK